MDTRPIGIFDSGVGGLTVFSEIEKELTQENLIYLGDTKNFPYGDKSKETIVKIATKCIEFLISKNVKLIVIACGTATSQALQELKMQFNIPIVGIINPTIMDIKRTINPKDKIVIGVMATEATIRSNQWKKQIQEEIGEIEVINQACPLLAPMAEQGWNANKVAKATIQEYLKPFQGKNIDKLILGCTHYPLFKELIQNQLGKDIEIINTGEKIAKYLKKYLGDNALENSQKKGHKKEYYLTDTECNFIKVARNILQEETIEDRIKKITIE